MEYHIEFRKPNKNIKKTVYLHVCNEKKKSISNKEDKNDFFKTPINIVTS